MNAASNNVVLLDCTLRDGGYYNNWDFARPVVEEYLLAMAAARLDYVELGFRSFDKSTFRGACFYTTDDYIRSIAVPPGLRLGVMMNASEVVGHADGVLAATRSQFVPKAQSPVSLVRFACHLHEFEKTLPACAWLKEQGYAVGINLMQIADRTDAEIEQIGKLASAYPLDALYFADSLGSMDPEQAAHIVGLLRRHWSGALGIHTHDNMGKAVANSLSAVRAGVTWVDSTVTGMGRGPGNAQTEYMAIELGGMRGGEVNLSPLLALIRRHFGPMQQKYGWGKNPYYHLAGKYGIHPTYVQEMLNDPRYGEAEILSVIEHLREVGGKKYSSETMEAGRQMFGGSADGQWAPAEVMRGREVLVLGAGPGVVAHRAAIEQFVRRGKPYVVALNTQATIDEDLVDLRVASHPFRLLADSDAYRTLRQPLAAPAARLPKAVLDKLDPERFHDFGLTVQRGAFGFGERSAVVPSSLAIAYALAVASSGRATRVLLAGFDGYGADDPRTTEMNELLAAYQAAEGAVPLVAITPTRYKVGTTSVYAL